MVNPIWSKNFAGLLDPISDNIGSGMYLEFVDLDKPDPNWSETDPFVRSFSTTPQMAYMWLCPCNFQSTIQLPVSLIRFQKCNPCFPFRLCNELLPPCLGSQFPATRRCSTQFLKAPCHVVLQFFLLHQSFSISSIQQDILTTHPCLFTMIDSSIVTKPSEQSPRSKWTLTSSFQPSKRKWQCYYVHIESESKFH